MKLSGVEQYRQRLQSAKARLVAALPVLAEDLAVSTLSVVKDRSINEGIEVDGSKKNYTTNQVYTSGFKKKVLNKGGAAYIAANKKGNWHGLRKAQGLRSDPVNLSYTNRMWTGIQVLSSAITGEGKVHTVVGAADQETEGKLAGNVERYGDFLEPTPEELEMQQLVIKDMINDIILGR